MKKRFDCGHLGRGQWCHRCALAKELEAQAANADTRYTRRAGPELLAEAARLRAVKARAKP